MSYNYALMVNGILAMRTITYKKAEKYNLAKFAGRGVIVPQAYVTGGN